MRMTQNIDGLPGLVDVNAIKLIEQETIPEEHGVDTDGNEEIDIKYEPVNENAKDVGTALNVTIEQNQLQEDTSIAL